MRGIPLPRLALALASVLVIAWSAVLWRDERVGYQAADRIFFDPVLSDSEWAQSLAQLRDAELLDPSTKWRVSRATALLLRDKAAAARLAESVVDREPDNLEAWQVIRKATSESDPQRARRALAQMKRLNPLPYAR